jgi:hypothetical protein
VGELVAAARLAQLDRHPRALPRIVDPSRVA